jgi:hypothetical protein
MGIAVAKTEKSRISGKDAVYVALDAAKYPPLHISEVDSSANGSDGAAVMEKLPAPVSDQPDAGEQRQAPPRVRKPSPIQLSVGMRWQCVLMRGIKLQVSEEPT